MSEEKDPKQDDLSADPKPGSDANDGGKESGAEGEKKFTQADFDAALKKALDQKEERAKKAMESAEEERRRKEAEAAGEWEKVNGQLKAENERLKSEKAALERQQLQVKVATEVGLPLQLADRLKGDDETAMTEDAKAILKLLPKPEVEKKAPPQGNGKENPSPKGTSDDKAAEAAKAAQATMIRSRI